MTEDFPVGTKVQDIDDIKDGFKIIGTVVEKPQHYEATSFMGYAYVLWENNNFPMLIRPKYLVKV